MERLVPVRFLLIFTGVLPNSSIQLDLLSSIYGAYSKFAQSYFIVFVVFQIIDIVNVCINFTNIYEVSDRMGVALLHINLIAKLLIMQSKKLDKVFKDFDETRSKILNGNDDIIKDIFLDHCRYTSIVSWYYYFLCWISIIALITASFISFIIQWDVDVNGPDIPLPLPSYIPFNTQKYYSIAFWIDAAAAHYAAANYTVTHSLLSGLLLFNIGQIKIFKHCLRNFTLYSKRMGNGEKSMSDEDKEMALIGCFAREHLKLKRNVQVLNSQFKYVALLEFLVMSVQLAFQIFQLLTTQMDIGVIFKFLFLCLNINQVFLFSYLANEIVVQSVGIPDAIFESDWFNKSIKVKKSFIFMMMNSKVPLQLTLGPFATVTAANSLNILKAAYSYTMLLMKT